jgi:hypothetical protein
MEVVRLKDFLETKIITEVDGANPNVVGGSLKAVGANPNVVGGSLKADGVDKH